MKEGVAESRVPSAITLVIAPIVTLAAYTVQQAVLWLLVALLKEQEYHMIDTQQLPEHSIYSNDVQMMRPHK